MNTKYLIGITIVSLVLGVGAVVFFNTQTHLAANGTSQSAATAASASEEPAPLSSSIPETTQLTQDWRGYENKEFRFGLLYPDDLHVKEYKERSGALSVVFEERVDEGRGFQIYVTSYVEDHITPERFLLDVSSGVMEEPTDIVIGGVPAIMFFSENSIMGDTREVWFINNGFLYEVVTYKQLDAWLSTIMQSWQFF
jgi:hypothetical protein